MLAIFIVFPLPVFAATYYVAPDKNPDGSVNTIGRDTNPGTQSQPWKTFDRAWKTVKPGDTLLLLDGTFLQSLHPTVDGKENTVDKSPTFDLNDYKTFPLDHPLRTKYYITVKAVNDGGAIIDGDTNGDGFADAIPVFLGDRCLYYTCNQQPAYGDGFILEGLVAKNSSSSIYLIQGHDVIIRRCSGYDANTDTNSYIFHITSEYSERSGSPIQGPANILLEDDVAAGSGRKMAVTIAQTGNVVFRRIFAAWQEWRNDNPWDPNEWPWGDGIEDYTWGDADLSNSPNMLGNTMFENSIVYGMLPTYGFSLSPNNYGPVRFNKFYGLMSIGVGQKWDMKTLMTWPCPNPAKPTQHCHDFSIPQHRAGFDLGIYNTPTLTHNRFSDLFAYGNAAPGITAGPWVSSSSDNSISNVTLAHNGLAPGNQWTGTQIFDADLARFTSASNLYIEGKSAYNDKSKGARLRYRYVNGNLMDGTNNQPAQELWPWPMEDRIHREFAIHLSKYFATNPQLQNFSVNNSVIPLINQYTAVPVPLTVSPTATPPPVPTATPTATPIPTPNQSSQAPYPNTGVPAAIPGTIEAVNFDSGGEGVAYHDMDTKNLMGAYRSQEGVDIEPSNNDPYDITSVWPGEWLEYSVLVASGGTYTVSITTAHNGFGATAHLEQDGIPVSGTITFPNTAGWQNFQTSTTNVNLSAGKHILRLKFDRAGSTGYEPNLLRYQFSYIGGPTPTSIPPSPTASTNKPGDANGDGLVDGRDYIVWVNHYGTASTGSSNGDFNNDTIVDGRDYIIWVNNYGK
jgi:hypothetical protein